MSPRVPRIPRNLRAAARGLGIGLGLGLAAGLSLLATEAALAQQKPYVPPPAPKPTAVAPKGDFTAGLPTATSGAAPEAGSDEAFRAQAEAEALRRSALPIKRAGTRLILPTATGRPVVFDSVIGATTDASGENYQDYRFDGLSPDREFYVVSVTFHEGSDLYWISRQDGTRHAVHGRPLASPDSTLLVMANGSAARDFNGIILWERNAGRLVERFRLEPEGDQYGFYRVMRWKDNRTVELERLVIDGSTCGGGAGESLAALVREGDRWTLKTLTALHCKT